METKLTDTDKPQFAPIRGWGMFRWSEESARAGRWVRWPISTGRYTEPRIVDVGYEDRMKAWVWRSARGWLKCTDEEIWEEVWWAGPIELPKAPIAKPSPNRAGQRRRKRERILNMSEPIEPEKPAVRCTGVVGDDEQRRTEVECAWLEWWDGETNPNSIDGGWMWREGYEAGRRAHEGSSPTVGMSRDRDAQGDSNAE